MAYDQAQIRKYIEKSFDDQEVRTFCFDYFPSVYEDLTDGMRKSRKVELLLSHCLRNNLMTDLVAALAREKPGPFVDEFLAQAPDELTEPVVISSSITRNPRQIFISHAHQDAELAHWLADKLNLHGWQSWIAPESIRPGEKWVEAINRGLAESGVFVLVLSEAAVQSRWVRSETNFAIQSEHEGKLKFVPLKTTPHEIPNTPPLWQTYQQVNFDTDRKAGLAALLTELEPQKMAQLVLEYTTLQNMAQAESWDSVQSIGQHIEANYPDYRAVNQLLTVAQHKLQSPTLAKTPKPIHMIPSTPKTKQQSPMAEFGLPVWVWWLGAVFLLVLGVWGINSIVNGGIGRKDESLSVTQTVGALVGMLIAEATPLPDNTTIPRSLLDPNVPPPEPTLGSTWQRPADGMTMVYVPSGTFSMGSSNDQIDSAFELCEQALGHGECERSWYDDEMPQHDVHLDGFWIDQTEVTNVQYAQCVTASNCNGSISGKDDHPLVNVSWNKARDYCEWTGGQLPTEAQWEYAARGKDGRIYPWGNEAPDCELANYGGCEGTIAPVGNYLGGSSWVGALDMAGNAWEWVADWYASDYYVHSSTENPQGPNSGSDRVLRGGAWDVNVIRVAIRSSSDPANSVSGVGFRCVQAALTSEAPTATSQSTKIATGTLSPTPTTTPTPVPTIDPDVPAPEPTLGSTWERPADEMSMVYVPGGTFPMGSDPEIDTNARSDEQPQHEVSLDAFWIDKYEVTNAQFANFLNAAGNQEEGGVTWFDINSSFAKIGENDGEFNPDEGFEQHPVVEVSWYGANAYCEWAGGQLPTEAQWEYAARGADGRLYPWGNASSTCDLANYGNCSGGTTLPVGSLSPASDSWSGTADMAGNVWEWVQDWFASDYYASSPPENPQGPTSGDNKVLRGGSWVVKFGGSIRAADRFVNDPPNNYVGLRCAQE